MWIRGNVINVAHNYALVKVDGETNKVVVPISSGKPEIPDKNQMKWQKIVDLIAQIMNVPTGLITRLTTENLEIFIASNTEKNPYHKNDKDKLGIGMFCETVAGKRKELMVTDTEKSDYWRTNPHAQLGMHAYMGIPIEWEDGEVFGTLCMLDDKANPFSQSFLDLIKQFKEIIETDLKYLLLQEQLEKKLSARELQLRESNHRIRNHFNLLISFLRIQSREMNDDQALKMVLKQLESRIKTISLIHEKLYQTSCATKISLNDYIRQLCDYIIQNLADRTIAVHYEVDPISLTPEHSVRYGLIVSELITNSLKHAFKDVPDPEIEIQINRSGVNETRIIYRDNGKGFPKNFDIDQADSVGMNLIKLLVKQFDGQILIKDLNKAQFHITLQSTD